MGVGYVVLSYVEVVTAASILGAASDIACQYIVFSYRGGNTGSKRGLKEKKIDPDEDGEDCGRVECLNPCAFELDRWRTARFAATFGIFGGAVSVTWYQFALPALQVLVNQHQSDHNPDNEWDQDEGENFWLNVGLDQITAATSMVSIMIVNETLKDEPDLWDRLVYRFKHDVWKAVLLGEIMLIPCQYIMFAYLEPYQRPYLYKFCSALTMVVISYYSNRPREEEDKKIA